MNNKFEKKSRSGQLAGNLNDEKANYLTDQPNATNFSVGDKNFNVIADQLQQRISAIARPAKKVVRVFRCFACFGHFKLSKMSACLVICRKCHAESRKKGERARRKFTVRTTARISEFLGGGVV